MRRLIQFSVAAGVGVLMLALWRLGESPEGGPVRAEPPAMKHKSYKQTIPDTKTTFEMIAIPGGTYKMGSPAGEKDRKDDEGPQHPVAIRPFWMGKCEVTWDEFDLFWRAHPGQKEDKEPENPKNADAVTRPTPPYADETFKKGREGKPVLCITQHTAMQYCRWLSVKTGKIYRLPTEAEWEYACRAGTTTAYSFGDDPKKLGEYAWFADNADEKTHTVGTKKPNPWGLHDMYGNVCEWCLDHYDAKYYSRFPLDKPTLSPVLLPTEKRFPHVTRGGSWGDEAKDCRSAARLSSELDWMKQDPQRPRSIWWLTDADFVGFRVVRPVEEQDNLKGLRSKITRQSPVD
ncbi:MAG TPA: formylglycine-generating enzyme family protein [Gemmataceae bacterium]|nr:formylglycine-generating enzyme family protein [Gemmataceae bacterium]